MRPRQLAVAAATAVVSFLLGCATPPPEPVGPSASIADSQAGGGFAGADFFYVAEIDGRPVPNSLVASRVASLALGPHMVLVPRQRKVAAGRTRLRLRAEHAYAAPIQYLTQSAASHSADGVVEVELQADVRYVVTGRLDAFRREVWLAEEATGRVVGEKIVEAAWGEASANRTTSAATCTTRTTGSATPTWRACRSSQPAPA